MKAVISIILSVIMALGASDPLAAARRPSAAKSATLAAPAAQVSAALRPGIAWEDMAYSHYDPADFYDGVEELTALAGGEDAQAVTDLYDELYDELARIDTLCSIAYIRYCGDVTDEYWSGESVYSEGVLSETTDALSTACRQVMAGPCADAFRAHIGDGAADAFAAYVPLTDRESELLARESELVDEYYSIMDGADDAVFEYDGETWDWDRLNGMDGMDLAYRDYDGYLEVYYGLQRSINQQVGPVFLEMVQLRAEIAQIEGYESYADLVYEQTYGRDYTCADAQALCDAVKKLAPSYYEDLYYSDLVYAAGDVTPIMDQDALLETVGQYAARLDPMLAEPWEFMTTYGLYDLGDGEGRMDGAYTLGLSQPQEPFVFITLGGDCYDLGTLSHEFGHYVNEYYCPVPDLLTSVGSFDLMEIHSTGLEALFTAFYDDIYDTGADIARFCALDGLMGSVLSGCIEDEFQRRIYAQPDMTLEEINALYAQVCAQYGMYEPDDEDYSWMYIPHTFENPLYYISYAASALAAIQIWELAQDDLDAGVEAWKAVLNKGGYGEGYMTVLPACGLRLFTEEGAVEQICAPLIEELDRLNAGA